MSFFMFKSKKILNILVCVSVSTFFANNLLASDILDSSSSNKVTEADPAIKKASSEVPLNSYGAVDVNAHVPLDVQVPKAPANQVNPVPKSLVDKFPSQLPAKPNFKVNSYLLLDPHSGQVFADYNSYKRVPPASLAKLMLIYIVEQHLVSGDLKLDQKLRVPEVAWATGGSRMFLKQGSMVSVQDLLEGIIVSSGNDAAVTFAVNIAGTQESFVHLMNNEARKLGMKNTRYATVMGLPAPNEYTCAYDLSLLAKSVMIDYPDYFPLFKQKWIKYGGIKQPNYNKLLFIYPDATGMKTGSTSYAGYSLIGSAKEKDNDMPLIAVVLGADNRMASATGAQALLKYGFHFFKAKVFYSANDTVKNIPVYFGDKDNIAVGVKNDIWVSYPKELKDKVKARLQVPDNLQAPIHKGQVIGKLVFYVDSSSSSSSSHNSASASASDSDSDMSLPNQGQGDQKSNKIILKTSPVFALENISKGSLFKRIKDKIRLWWA